MRRYCKVRKISTSSFLLNLERCLFSGEGWVGYPQLIDEYELPKRLLDGQWGMKPMIAVPYAYDNYSQRNIKKRGSHGVKSQVQPT